MITSPPPRSGPSKQAKEVTCFARFLRPRHGRRERQTRPPDARSGSPMARPSPPPTCGLSGPLWGNAGLTRSRPPHPNRPPPRAA